MPRDLRVERHYAIDIASCHSDACEQGRKPCPFPTACQTSEPSARSWRASDLTIFGIFVLVLVGFAAGWFGGIGS